MKHPEPYSTINDLVIETANKYRDKRLFRYEDEIYSYKMVNTITNTIANSLLDMGVGKGDHVGLYLYNSAEYLMAWFALAKIGAVVVPIDTRFKSTDLNDLVLDSDANYIFIDSNTRSCYESVRDNLDLESEFLINPKNDVGDYILFSELANGGNTEPPEIGISPSDPLSIIYCTSEYRRVDPKYHANESLPPGIVLPHYAFLVTGWDLSQRSLQLTQEDRLLTTLPLFNTNALQFTVLGSMLSGADFVLVNKFEPDRYWDQVRKSDATVISHIESMLTVLHNQPEKESDIRNPVKYTVGNGANEEIIEDFERRFDLTVIEGYGLVETSTVTTVNCIDDRRIGSIGKPVDHLHIEIVDDNGWPVDANEEGEIVVRPKRPNTMMKEYYKKPKKTLRAREDQWFHTGDIGYQDEDGYLYFVASKRHSIRRLGGLISSLEIESVIETHPDVEKAVVFGIENEVGTEEVKSVVCLKSESALSPPDILRYCENHLAHFKLPRYIEIVDELPTTPSGKIKRSELKNRENHDTWDRRVGYDFTI